jgi:hypothetical protein
MKKTEMLRDIAIKTLPKRLVQIRYVIASTPRSGTAYISQVLSSLGLECGHERFFGVSCMSFGKEVCNPTKREYWTRRNNALGDSSWLVVPHLACLPKEAKIIHIVRDPIASLNSMIHTDHFRWDINDDHWTRKYAQYIFKELGQVAWPDDQLGRAQLFYVQWHKLILEHSSSQNYVFSCLEDIDRSFIKKVLCLIGYEGVSDLRIDAALEEVPPTFNRRKRKPTDYIEGRQLNDEFIELSRSFGYELPANAGSLNAK